jgi:hypothetical protein
LQIIFDINQIIGNCYNQIVHLHRIHNMKILNLAMKLGHWPAATVDKNPIDKRIFNSLSIGIDSKVEDRGVITYETLTGLKAINHQSALIPGNQNLAIQILSNITKAALMFTRNNIELNKISLVPENRDYPGFIIAFRSEYSGIMGIIITLDSDNEEVVVTNQTTFVTALDNYGSITSGTLTVIHCPEHVPLEFNFYSTQVYTNGSKEAACNKCKMYIEPLEQFSNNQYEVKLELEKVYDVESDFLQYLINSLNQDAKDVFNVLDDPDLLESTLVLFRNEYKKGKYDKTLSYSSSKVI